MKKNKKIQKKSLALVTLIQIFLLVTLSIAISYVLYKEVGVVSAGPDDPLCTRLTNHRVVAKGTCQGEVNTAPFSDVVNPETQECCKVPVEQSSEPKLESNLPGLLGGPALGLAMGRLDRILTLPRGLETNVNAGANVEKPPVEQATRSAVARTVLDFAAVIGFSYSVFRAIEGTTSTAGAFLNALGGGAAARHIVLRIADILKIKNIGFLSKAAFGWAIGGAVFLGELIIGWKDTKTEVVSFSCLPWDAQTGGERCDLCNQQGDIPCSEYQCRSLGQGCELINKGEGKENERCVWINRNDVTAPVIEPRIESLSPGLEYWPDNAVSPPSRGVIIRDMRTQSGCVPAFTPFSFGIKVSEPAKCKLDLTRKDNFEDMKFFYNNDPRSLENHTQVFSLPGPQALEEESLTLQNDGAFELFTKCQDSNGNVNEADFVFKYCVGEEEDLTAPIIVTTDVLNNAPIAFDQTELGITVFTSDESGPSQCRWSHIDQEYDDMKNDMSCPSSVTSFNAQNLYECKTTLTGIKNSVDNEFFFRCIDKKGNKNRESFVYTIKGTEPLVITSIGPEGVIKDSATRVRVKLTATTFGGAEKGKAICEYSLTGEQKDFIEFINTNSHEHEQELFLEPGDYDITLKCVDLGGNQDTNSTQFTVESDTSPPLVVRAFQDVDSLRITTNENASCVFDYVNCTYPFEEGIKMRIIEKVDHLAKWETDKTFYIKCMDDFGNQPAPNQCSAVIRPFDR